MKEFVATHLGLLYPILPNQLNEINSNNTRISTLQLYSFGGQKYPKTFPTQLIAKHIIKDDSPKFISKLQTKFSGVMPCSDIRKMFVFGAGASFQCAINKNEKFGLPTTNKLLFDKELITQLKKFPIGNDLLVKNSFEGFSLEFELERRITNLESNRFSKVRASNITLLNLILAEYFADKSNQILNGDVSTLYDAFISRLIDYSESKALDENFVLVNFNYDILIEGSIQKLLGQSYNSVADYISPKFYPFRYYKPHGSCNWGLELDSNTSNGKASSMTLLERIIDKKITPFEILAKSVHHNQKIVFDEGSYYENKTYGESYTYSYNLNSVRLMKNEGFKDTNMFYPVIHLPFAKKDTFLMPPLLRYQLNRDLEHVEEMFIIGFRMSELYFNNVLKATFEKNKRLKVIWVINPDYVNITNYLKQTFNLNGVIIKQVRSFREFVCYHLESVLSIPTQSPASDPR